MKRLVVAASLALAACQPADRPAAIASASLTATPNAAASAEPTPVAKDGWREYPLRDGVIAISPVEWKHEKIDIPLRKDEDLEYKLAMKKGQTIVYTISYPGIEHPGHVISEFHGHTKQVDGVGDLMFYSKAAGSTQYGSFTAPWDGIHGWYLKNEGPKDLVVKLEVAGFYDKQK